MIDWLLLHATIRAGIEDASRELNNRIAMSVAAAQAPRLQGGNLMVISTQQEYSDAIKRRDQLQKEAVSDKSKQQQVDELSRDLNEYRNAHPDADREELLRKGQSVYDPHNQLNADKPKDEKAQTQGQPQTQTQGHGPSHGQGQPQTPQSSPK